MQPPNDATYSPMSQERVHGQPGRFRPSGERHPGFPNAGIPSFPLYDEAQDAENFRAFLKDAAAKRLGVTWDFDSPVTLVCHLDGNSIGISVVL